MMKNLRKTLIISVFSLLSYSGYAQQDSTKNWKISGENTFLVNQATFSNWAAGGINALSANLVLNYDFNYAKDLWSWDNKVIAAYGLSKQKNIGWRKNDDRLVLNSLLGYKVAERWMYTFYMNFNTQFSNGYNYDSNNVGTLISESFAPAYLSFGPGFSYKESDNFKFNLSPAATRLILVRNKTLGPNYGLKAGKTAKVEFGASFDAYYKLEVMENVSLENTLKLYSNYLEKPKNVDIDYTVNLFMKVNKFITVNAGLQMVYDDDVKIKKEDGSVGAALQLRQVVGAGLTYKF